jgi:hypothetical protein
MALQPIAFGRWGMAPPFLRLAMMTIQVARLTGAWKFGCARLVGFNFG